MVAFNFKPDFVPAIEAGIKKQTIRKTARCKRGDVMQLFTEQRTKKCRKIGEAVCKAVFEVTIMKEQLYIQNSNKTKEVMAAPEFLESFARMTGFISYKKQAEFYERFYTLPFNGVVHMWENFVTGNAILVGNPQSVR